MKAAGREDKGENCREKCNTENNSEGNEIRIAVFTSNDHHGHLSS